VAADSRTHAGVDYISTYKNSLIFLSLEAGCILSTAGSLSLVKTVLTLLRKILGSKPVISTCPLYTEVAHISVANPAVHEQDRSWLQQDRIDFKHSLGWSN